MNGLLETVVYDKTINCSNCAHSLGAGGASSGGGGLAPTVPSSHHVMKAKKFNQADPGAQWSIAPPSSPPSSSCGDRFFNDRASVIDRTQIATMAKHANIFCRFIVSGSVSLQKFEVFWLMKRLVA